MKSVEEQLTDWLASDSVLTETEEDDVRSTAAGKVLGPLMSVTMYSVLHQLSDDDHTSLIDTMNTPEMERFVRELMASADMREYLSLRYRQFFRQRTGLGAGKPALWRKGGISVLVGRGKNK